MAGAIASPSPISRATPTRSRARCASDSKLSLLRLPFPPPQATRKRGQAGGGVKLGFCWRGRPGHRKPRLSGAAHCICRYASSRISRNPPADARRADLLHPPKLRDQDRRPHLQDRGSGGTRRRRCAEPPNRRARVSGRLSGARVNQTQRGWPGREQCGDLYRLGDPLPVKEEMKKWGQSRFWRAPRPAPQNRKSTLTPFLSFFLHRQRITQSVEIAALLPSRPPSLCLVDSSTR